jgi:glycosyl transferase family 25
MNFADFFERVYILNLPERTDRLRHMRRELDRIGMPLDGDRVRLFKAIRSSDKAPFHRVGSKGCFLSVLEILRTCRQDHATNVLILQDDAKFSALFGVYESQITAQLSRKDWDIAQFGYVPLHADARQTEILNPPPSLFGALVPFSGELIHAHCFAVNGKSLASFVAFLEELLTRPREHPNGGPMPIDGAFNHYSRRPDVTRLIAIPSLVSQVSSRSDVTPMWLDRVPAFRPVLAVARGLGLPRIFRRS